MGTGWEGGRLTREHEWRREEGGEGGGGVDGRSQPAWWEGGVGKRTPPPNGGVESAGGVSGQSGWAESAGESPQTHTNTKWRYTKSDDNRCTSKVTPLLAEPLCCTVSYRYVSDHLYLSRLSAGLGVRSWRWMISRHGTRSPARRAPCRRSRTT